MGEGYATASSLGGRNSYAGSGDEYFPTTPNGATAVNTAERSTGRFSLPPEMVRRAFRAIRSGGGMGKGGGRRTDSQGGGDTRLLRPEHVLCSDSEGPGSQAGNRSERHLRHPAENEDRHDAGIGALVRE